MWETILPACDFTATEAPFLSGSFRTPLSAGVSRDPRTNLPRFQSRCTNLPFSIVPKTQEFGMHPKESEDATVELCRESLLSWYGQVKRDFPWRSNPDPYHVWVCEVMSQQTTLKVVLPYFERFVEALPNCRSLAEAPESQLRSLWQGLGYYSRVRNLQRGALHILSNYGEEFPNAYESWLAVPSCGPYTAAVIASVCFGEAVPCVDGNVVRVVSRHAKRGAEVWAPSFRNELMRELGEIICRKNPGDFNQALMELGATVCKPRRPLCEACPVQTSCQSHADGCVHLYPPPKPQKSFRDVELVGLVAQEGGQRVHLVHRRRGFLSETCGFPLLTNREELCRRVRHLGLEGALDFGSRLVKHTITRNRIRLTVAELRCSSSQLSRLISSCSQDSTHIEVQSVGTSQVRDNLSSSLDCKIWEQVFPSRFRRCSSESELW